MIRTQSYKMTLVPLTGQLQAFAERFKFVVIGLFDLTGAGPDQGDVLQPLEFHHPAKGEIDFEWVQDLHHDYLMTLETEMLDPLDSEEMLSPEPEVDAGDESMAEETLPADLPTVELVGTDGATLQTVSGGDSGSGLGEGMGAGTGAGASFFGISAAGNRIAYIVDISGSMNQSGKIIIAINEL